MILFDLEEKGFRILVFLGWVCFDFGLGFEMESKFYVFVIYIFNFFFVWCCGLFLEFLFLKDLVE